MSTNNFSFVVKNGLVVNGSFTANSTVVNAAAINAVSMLLSTGANIGSNVVLTTNQIRVGNSTVNVTVSNNQITVGANSILGTADLKLGNSTVNSTLSATNLAVTNSTATSTIAPGTISAGSNAVLSTTGLVVGNSTVNSVVATTNIKVGNSTANVTISNNQINVAGATVNSTVYSGTANNASNLGGVAPTSYVNTSGAYTISGVHTHTANLVVGNSTVNVATTNSSVAVANSTATTIIVPGTVNTSTLNVGANVNLSTTQIKVGNSTSNVVITSTSARVGNSTVNVTVSNNQVAVGANSILSTADLKVGNSTVNSTVNSTAFTVSNSTITTAVNAGGVTVGANVVLASDSVTVGNSTVNSSISTAQIFTDGNLTAEGVVRLNSESYITGNTVITPSINTTGFTVTSESFSVASRETGPSGLVFKPDGTRFYIVGRSSDRINVFDVQTPWIISGAAYVSNTNIVSETTEPTGLFIRPDGLKAYVVSNTSPTTVFQYSLNEAWGNSFTYDSVSLNVSGTSDANATSVGATDIAFSPDGRYFFLTTDADTDARVHRYELSTPWDLTTGAYSGNTYLNEGVQITPTGIAFADSGTLMYILGSQFDKIDTFRLSIPWNLATVQPLGSSVVNASGGETNPNAMYFKPDGSKVYVVGTGLDTIHEYSVPSTTTYLNGNVQIGSATIGGVMTSAEANVSARVTVGNVVITRSQINVGSATVNSTVYSGTANNATNLGGQPATFYTNATNLSTGLVNTQVLGSGTANSTTFLGGDRTYKTAVTSVATGSGLSGGPVTTTGTLSVLANNGIIANATGVYVNGNTGLVTNTTGVHVNSSYIATITVDNANSARYANESSTNTFTVGTATYFVSNGNLGVGTSSPASKLTVNGTTALSGNVTITGNLTVTGTTLYVNTQVLNIGDNIITLNADLPGGTAPSENSGLEINRGSSANVVFRWNETVDNWEVTKDGSTYANLVTVTELSAYQTTAGLSANVATLTSNNATNLNGQPASFYTNATNLNVGTVATARLGSGTANSTTFLGGDQTYKTAVTSVGSGSGLTGGSITTSGTLSVLANTGIVANATGVYVNSSYIATLTANNATNLNGQSASFYTNATNLDTGTLDTARLPATANISTAINVGANVNISTTQLNVGNTTTNVVINSTSVSISSDPIVQLSDIGTEPNQIPLNQHLGTLAYQSVLLRPVTIITTAGDYTATALDDIIIINKVTGASTTVNLPAGVARGKTYTIKDGKGDAATNNITLAPAFSITIDNNSTYVLNVNYGSVTVVYTGDDGQWRVI